MRTERVLLVDNGSLEPASTRQLRRLAAALQARIGVAVDPVSLAHATRVPAAALDGRPAELFEAGLDRVITEGARGIAVLPLFVGPSYAIMRQLPALVAERTRARPELRVGIAPPLFVEGETRLAEILADHVREQIADGGEKPRVAVVDHGSPSQAVTAVRDAVAAQVRERLGDAVREVAACSMERRPGAEFEFNEPLLENLLTREGWREGPMVVALLFIASGKHAGPDGDVAQIVARARGESGMSEVRFTRVMGEHPRLVEILVERWRATRLARVAQG